MKATTTHKWIILQKNDQNFKVLLYNMMNNYELKIFWSDLLLIDSPVNLTPLKQFHIQLSPQIFGKNQNHPRVPLRGPGGPTWCKKPTLKNLETLSL